MEDCNLMKKLISQDLTHFFRIQYPNGDLQLFFFMCVCVYLYEEKEVKNKNKGPFLFKAFSSIVFLT